MRTPSFFVKITEMLPYFSEALCPAKLSHQSKQSRELKSLYYWSGIAAIESVGV